MREKSKKIIKFETLGDVIHEARKLMTDNYDPYKIRIGTDYEEIFLTIEEDRNHEKTNP